MADDIPLEVNESCDPSMPMKANECYSSMADDIPLELNESYSYGTSLPMKVNECHNSAVSVAADLPLEDKETEELTYDCTELSAGSLYYAEIKEPTCDYSELSADSLYYAEIKEPEELTYDYPNPLL